MEEPQNLIQPKSRDPIVPVWHFVWQCVFAARCYTSAAYAVMPSVTFVNPVKTNKHIFIFSPSGSHTILVFQYQPLWQYCDGNPINEVVECRWSRQKSRFWANIWLHRTLLTLPPASQHGVAGLWQVVTLIAGGKWWSLLTAGDDDEIFMIRSLNLMLRTTEQHLIVRSGLICSICY